MERARVPGSRRVDVTRKRSTSVSRRLHAARAGEMAAQVRVTAAEHALEAAMHDAELYQVNIADNTLVAPRDGRIAVSHRQYWRGAAGWRQGLHHARYRLCLHGHLPADVDPDHVKVGDDARIVLDAYPDHPIPAKVTFIADHAQFTPKMVETQTERDKLMFRDQ